MAGVLGAAAVIAVIRGDGVFGIFAANHRTEIVWGGAAILLVVLSMLPRVGGRSRTVQEPVARDERVVREPDGRDGRVGDEPVRDEPVVQDDLVAHRERTVGDGDDPVARDETVAPDRR